MIDNILNLIEEQSCHAQGSSDWFRDRLGCISSSCVSFVMLASKEQVAYEKLLKSKPEFKAGKAKIPAKSTSEQIAMLEAAQADADKAKYAAAVEEWEQACEKAKAAADANPFSDTCKAYLRKVAAERNLQPRYVEDDDLFAEFRERTEINRKAIRYGSENEDIARQIYKRKEKMEINESGFIRHTEIPMYGDSPDGVVFESKKRVIAIEIKFPNPDTWIKYAEEIHSAADLKDVKDEYYWQCMSHIECGERYYKAIGALDEDGEVVCDFIFCDKMQNGGYRKIRIEANREDIALMCSRVEKANAYIDNLLERIKQ